MAEVDALQGRGEPRRPEPGAEAPVDEAGGPVMSLVDHLAELRRRLAIALLGLAVGAIVGFLLSDEIVRLLANQVPGQRLVTLTPGGALFLRLKVALILGFALALPLILYQAWAFVAPGLTRRERTVARPWIPLTGVFFLLGLAVAWFILPYTLSFLYSFQTDQLQSLPAAEPYFDFVTTMFLAFGAVMQFPIVLVVLARLGLVSVERLRRSRRYVLLGITIFAVLATPGGDPISPVAMGGVMFLLYEATILILDRAERRGEGARG
jgi:sec-independent protein translocase protein TatC